MSGDPFSLLNVFVNTYIILFIIIGLYFFIFIVVFIGIGWKLGDIRNYFRELIDKIEEKSKNSGN